MKCKVCGKYFIGNECPDCRSYHTETCVECGDLIRDIDEECCIPDFCSGCCEEKYISENLVCKKKDECSHGRRSFGCRALNK